MPPDTSFAPARPRSAAPTPPWVPIGGGHALFVRDWGEGPPVLLLSGWGMDSALWGETMALLNGCGLRAIAYDRRGHGRSTDPGGMGYDALADDLEAVLRTLELEGVTIVAHSGAGGEAIRHAARHGSGRVGQLVLVGATGPCMRRRPDNPLGLPEEAVRAAMARLRDDLPGWIDDNAGPFAPGAARRTLDWLAAMLLGASRRAILDFHAEILDADLRAEAADLRLPVTLIHGDRDASAPMELTARRYAELIPGCELLVYPGVAHGVMVTHARRLADDIARTVARDAREPGGRPDR